ncbi:MAG: hypothetical protein LC658_13500, partial [Bacteroidales bacterium]|nr:hypothetical protein [Bacteroidales bacterium]
MIKLNNERLDSTETSDFGLQSSDFRLNIMTYNDKIKLAQNIAVIAGIFSAVVALLLLLNYWQISKTDPIES